MKLNSQDRHKASQIPGRGMYATSGILVQVARCTLLLPVSLALQVLDLLRVGSLLHVASSGDMYGTRQEPLVSRLLQCLSGRCLH